MLPDLETTANIKQQIADTLAQSFDYVSYDDDGKMLLVQDGYWFEMDPQPVDNGEE
jgi:hypothetical protein